MSIVLPRAHGICTALESAKNQLIQNENSQTEIGTFARQLEEIDKAQRAIIEQF